MLMKKFTTRRRMTEALKTSGFRSTLRRLASEADPTERARVADLFANQIELALDTQGGNMQVALWNVEEGIAKKIDDIHKYIGDANTLQSAVLEAVSGLRTDVQHSAAETAARLKKHDDDIETLLSVQNEYGSRLNALDDIEAWRGKVDKELIEAGERMSKIEQADRDDIRTEIKNTNTEITSMKEMLKRYDSELRELVDRLAARGGNENGSG